MGWLDRLGALFKPQPRRFEGTFYQFTVRCKRCGELIEGKINIYNDPSVEYGDGGKVTYFCRKGLMGAGQCYQQIEVTFRFDERRKVLEKTISGGEFVET